MSSNMLYMKTQGYPPLSRCIVPSRGPCADLPNQTAFSRGKALRKRARENLPDLQ
jgi:hypothetical protein